MQSQHNKQFDEQPSFATPMSYWMYYVKPPSEPESEIENGHITRRLHRPAIEVVPQEWAETMVELRQRPGPRAPRLDATTMTIAEFMKHLGGLGGTSAANATAAPAGKPCGAAWKNSSSSSAAAAPGGKDVGNTKVLTQPTEL